MNLSRLVLCFILFESLVGSPASHAQTPMPTPSRVSTNLRVAVETATGEQHAVTNLSWSADWQLTGQPVQPVVSADSNPNPSDNAALPAADSIQFAGTDLYRITFLPLANLLPAPPACLVLSAEERWLGELAEMQEQHFHFLSTAWQGPARVPVAAVRGLVFQSSRTGDPDRLEKLSRIILQHEEPTDLLVLTNGDQLRGTLLQLGGERVEFGTAARDVLIDREFVAAIALDRSFYETATDPDLYAQLWFHDGTRLSSNRLVSVEQGWEVTTRFGTTGIIQPAAISQIRFRNGRVQYLSELPASNSTYQPFLDDAMPPRQNQSVLATPLRLRSVVYPLGLGVRSRTELTFDAAGAIQFATTLGLDDAAPDSASVRCRILLDGELAYESPELLHSTDPIPIRLEFQDRRTITLITDYAKRADVGDFCDWCDARLIRAKTNP